MRLKANKEENRTQAARYIEFLHCTIAYDLAAKKNTEEQQMRCASFFVGDHSIGNSRYERWYTQYSCNWLCMKATTFLALDLSAAAAVVVGFSLALHLKLFDLCCNYICCLLSRCSFFSLWMKLNIFMVFGLCCSFWWWLTKPMLFTYQQNINRLRFGPSI